MEQKNDNFRIGIPFLDKRPIAITLLCLLGFLGVMFSVVGFFIPSIINPFIKQYGFSFILFSVLASILSLVGLIGYWKMRKWGVYFFTISVVVSLAYGIFVGLSPDDSLNYGDYLVLIIGFIYFKKMK